MHEARLTCIHAYAKVILMHNTVGNPSERRKDLTPNGVIYSQWDHDYRDYFTADQSNNLILQRWQMSQSGGDLQETDMAPAEPLETIAPIPPEKPGTSLSTQYRGEDGQLHDSHGRY